MFRCLIIFVYKSYAEALLKSSTLWFYFRLLRFRLEVSLTSLSPFRWVSYQNAIILTRDSPQQYPIPSYTQQDGSLYNRFVAQRLFCAVLAYVLRGSSFARPSPHIYYLPRWTHVSLMSHKVDGVSVMLHETDQYPLCSVRQIISSRELFPFLETLIISSPLMELIYSLRCWSHLFLRGVDSLLDLHLSLGCLRLKS